ncbi:MAG: serine/threonine protein kinase [Cyanobacteria bacterium SZAS LIN-5]|nr:serine/threonine protein kinase [Cyanobacteria bacterium SZAS LIN-5]
MPDEKSQKVDRKSCTKCKKSYFVNLKVCPNCGEQNADPFVGRTIADRFLVESIIGEGGMGVVYRAVNTTTKEAVAVKILRQQYMHDEIAARRFKHEAVATTRLSHPNIVAMHDYGSTVDGYLFMVMEIIDGKSLAKIVHERRSLTPVRTVHIIKQVCDALDHAHQQGVIHRDLKPGNILLTEVGDEKDYVKLVDFGIAKLLMPEGDIDETQIEQEGEVLGSPLYMSPEQCLGRELDGRSDIYSLGIVLYETLMGKVPFIGRTLQETVEMQVQTAPMAFSAKRPDLTLPGSLEAVVFKALQKKKSDRPQSMRELARDLESALADDGPRASKATYATSQKLPLKAIVVREEKRGIKVGLTIGLLIAVALAAVVLRNVTAGTPLHTVPVNSAPSNFLPTAK